MVLGQSSGSLFKPQCRQNFGAPLAGHKISMTQSQNRVAQPPARLVSSAAQNSQGAAVVERETAEPTPSVVEGQSVSPPTASDAPQESIPKPAVREQGQASQLKKTRRTANNNRSSSSQGMENGSASETEQQNKPRGAGRGPGRRHNSGSHAQFVVIESKGEPIPPEKVTFKEGDLLLGKVISEDRNKGWRVQLVDHPDILGICPPMFKPYTLRDSLSNFKIPAGSVGLHRMFKVEKVPEDMVYGGKGPVLNALVVDQNTVWRRAQQIQQIHTEKLDTLAVTIRTFNEAGLLGVWDGIPLFVPWKFSLTYARRPSQEEKQVLANKLVAQGKTHICIVDVLQEKNRFVGNLIEANQIRALEGVQIGDLIEAKVVNVSSYGVFLRTEAKEEGQHSMKGLLHIRNVSQGHAGDLNQSFKVGDAVKAFITDVDEKNQVEFSTMELESYPGEILEDKESCFARAESLGPWQELRDKTIAAKQEASRNKRGQQSYGGGEQRGRDSSSFKGNNAEVWRSRDDYDSPKGDSDLDW